MALLRNDTPFAFGHRQWPGVAKVIEESGEVLQVCGKLIATGGKEEHWDGTNLRQRLTEEVGQLLAALTFLIEKNDLSRLVIKEQFEKKLALYEKWHNQGDNP